MVFLCKLRIIILLNLIIVLSLAQDGDENAPCFSYSELVGSSDDQYYRYEEFSDSEPLNDEKYRKNFVTNGFYYCTDTIEGHLTSL